jgi:hypothetical protein
LGAVAPGDSISAQRHRDWEQEEKKKREKRGKAAGRTVNSGGIAINQFPLLFLLFSVSLC